MEVQKQTLKYHVKKDMVAFDCKLADLCIKPFSLGSLMKSSVDTHFNYVVDFWAVDDSEIMYLDDGKPSYIHKEDFDQFSKQIFLSNQKILQVT